MSHPTTTLALLDALQEKWHQRYMALSAKDSEKRVGRAVSEAANDLGDIIEAYESERLAREEPDEPMRTLPEAISSRIVIPHASFSLEMTSDGISPDLYAILTGSAMPAADITEEPPVGSQVTDGSGDIWERREGGWALWWPERSGWVYELLGGDPSPWPTVRSVAPLRPTTDADRERVGLPVKPAPADVDPDESLARALCDMGWTDVPTMTDWIDVARAAREHIEANQLYAYRPVAAERDKAEADLARVTDARDRHSRAADKWCNLYADKCEEIESVQAKADRYDALRADVSEKRWDNSVLGSDRAAYATVVLRGILTRDDERAES